MAELAPIGELFVRESFRLGIPSNTLLQSFGRDAATGDWYVAQPFGSSDLAIYRCGAPGAVLDYAVLSGGGHGTSIGLERDDDGVWIWLQWAGAPRRWRYVGDGAGHLAAATDAQTLTDPEADVPDRSMVCYSIDTASDSIATVWRSGGMETLRLRRLSEFKAGTGAQVYTIGPYPFAANLPQSITDDAAGVFQGFATTGGQVLVWRGGSKFPLVLSQYVWATGSRTDRDLSDIGNPTGYREAEGVAVWQGADGPVVGVGVGTGPTGDRAATVWTLSEVPEDEAAGGGGGTSGGSQDDGPDPRFMGAPVPSHGEGWHYFATRLDGNGGESLLASDLPLSDVQITRTLSGVDSLEATIPVEVPRLIGPEFDLFETHYNTAIYAELDGVIRAAGIVTSAPIDEPKVTITAEGFRGYLDGLPFDASKAYVQTDPLDIARYLWAHVQAAGGGNLGLTLDVSPEHSPVRVGLLPVEKWPVIKDGASGNPLLTEGTPFVYQFTTGSKSKRYGIATRTYEHVDSATWAYDVFRRRSDGMCVQDDTSEPPPAGWDVLGRVSNDSSAPSSDAEGNEYEAYTIAWWQDFDLGQVWDDLADAGGFDYWESHAWDGEDITHTLHVDYPGTGRRRDDLRFVVGENVLTPPSVDVDGAEYADEIVVLGAGEGRDMIRATWPITPRTGLHRPRIVTDSSIRSVAAAKARAQKEAAIYSGDQDVKELIVRNHPNAPLGSWGLGDVITVQGNGSGWTGGLLMNVRILAYTITPDKGDDATVTVARAEKVTSTSGGVPPTTGPVGQEL